MNDARDAMVRVMIPTRRTILKTITGSRLYGYALPESDKDKHGIFVPYKDYVLGIRSMDHLRINDPEGDCMLFSLQKFVKLMLKGSPQLISMLYTPKEFILHKDMFGNRLIENRHLFLSKVLIKSLMGMAKAHHDKVTCDFLRHSQNGGNEGRFYDYKKAVIVMRSFFEASNLLTERCPNLNDDQKSLLLDIRLGDVPFEEYERHFFAVSNAVYATYDSLNDRDPLKNEPRKGNIESLQIDLLETYWRNEDE